VHIYLMGPEVPLGCPSGMPQRSGDNGAVFTEHYVCMQIVLLA